MTPLHNKTPLITKQTPSLNIHLKLDNHQPAGSFKIRGIGNMCQKAIQTKNTKRFVASSGGNAGMAVAYAGSKLNIPVNVFVPNTTPEYMRNKLTEEGADVRVIGDVWDETNRETLKFIDESSEADNILYVPPFDHEDIWEGHASVVDELAREMSSPPDCIVVSVGGGGYFIGVCQGVQKVGWAQTTKVIAMETIGADSLYQSVQAKELITLGGITSIAKSLGALRVSQEALSCALSNDLNVISEVVTDEEALMACDLFQKEFDLLVEPACGASLATVYVDEVGKRVFPEGVRDVVVLVCGGNMIQKK